MRTLVTGGCGFIGQELVSQLCDRYGSSQVSVADSQTRAATGWYRVTARGVKVYRGQVQDAEFMTQVFESECPDVVIHCAAQSHVDQSLRDASSTWMANALGTQEVAMACSRDSVPMVYCSTDEVYGSTPVVDGVPVAVAEGDPMDPSSPYSASKLAGEFAVKSVSTSLGLRYAITRGNNCFGPWQLSEKLLPIAFNLLLSGKRVPLHGGGGQLRQWIHVSEFADALHRTACALLVGRVNNDEMNLVGPRLCSVKALVSAIAEHLGINPAQSFWESEDRPGQDTAYFCSGDKMARMLGGFRAVRDILDKQELDLLKIHYSENRSEVITARYVAGTQNNRSFA